MVYPRSVSLDDFLHHPYLRSVKTANNLKKGFSAIAEKPFLMFH